MLVQVTRLLVISHIVTVGVVYDLTQLTPFPLACWYTIHLHPVHLLLPIFPWHGHTSSYLIAPKPGTVMILGTYTNFLLSLTHQSHQLVSTDFNVICNRLT